MQTTIKYPKKKVQWHFALIAIILYLISYFFIKPVIAIAVVRLIAFYLFYRFTLRFFIEIHVAHHMYTSAKTFKEIVKKTLYNLLLLILIITYITAVSCTVYGFDPYVKAFEEKDGLQILFLGIWGGLLSLYLIILYRALQINLTRRGQQVRRFSM